MSTVRQYSRYVDQMQRLADDKYNSFDAKLEPLGASMDE